MTNPRLSRFSTTTRHAASGPWPGSDHEHDDVVRPGSAFAVYLLEARGFALSDFRVFQAVSWARLLRARDLMQDGANLPLVLLGAALSDISWRWPPGARAWVGWLMRPGA